MKKLLLFAAFFATVFAAELRLSGTVVSENQKMITSRYMGYVKEVKVSEGDIVKRDQILYEIDSIEIDNKKQQANLSLQMYENQYQLVQTNLARHKRLLQKDMVSKYEVENLELSAKNLSAMINIAKAQLREVQNQYKYLKVRATNNGVVVAKNIKVGEMAMPGVPAIVITDLSELKIMTEISESNLKEAKIGKEVEVFIPSLGFKTSGKIYSIVPSSNPLTHSFALKIKFDKGKQAVYPGMYSEVVVK
ncbi:MAG: efflux RND transporter periplasmic adaptor subunit [Helicobacteraceae bacterium]